MRETNKTPQVPSWYSNRPKPDPEWNTTAIKATYKGLVLHTSTPNPLMTFSYTLENTGRSNYTLDDNTNYILMAIDPEAKSLQPDSSLSLTKPVYVPAHQKVVVEIVKTCEYNSSYLQSEKDNPEKLGPFMNRRLKELDGFVIFDRSFRHKITLPNGWPDAIKSKTD